MKTKSKVLAIAIVSMLLPAMAFAETIKTKDNRGSGYGEAGSGRTTSAVTSNEYWGKFYQWFGGSLACPKQTSTCTFEYSTSRDISQTWQVGTELKTQANFGFGSADDSINASYAVSVDYSRSYTYSVDIDGGYTGEASTFVNRNKVVRSYKGVWKLTNTTSTGCGFLALQKCYYYTWYPNEALGTITALVSQNGTKSTFTFLIYKTGYRPAYKLEAD